MSKVAFIGLGVMGYPMAGFISKAGHEVTVFNRTSSKAEKWVSEYSGSKADTPAEAAIDADFIFTCVGNDDDYWTRPAVGAGCCCLQGMASRSDWHGSTL